MWFGAMGGSLSSLFNVILEKKFKKLKVKSFFLEKVEMWKPCDICVDCGMENLNVDLKKIIQYFFISFFLHEV